MPNEIQRPEASPQTVSSNDPAPLSRLLGLPVLISDPMPLTSALNLPALLGGVRDFAFGRRSPVKAFSLGAAAAHNDMSGAGATTPELATPDKTSKDYMLPKTLWAHFGREDMYVGAVIAVMILGPLVSAPHS